MIPTRTLGRVIQEQERAFPQRTGEFSSLITSIALGIKILSNIVATAGFKGLYGYSGRINVQNERTRLLDEQADQVLVEILGSSGHFGLLVSEERDTVIEAPAGNSKSKYVVAFDPLDGSSNIGSNIPVGTIFAVFRKKDPERMAHAEDFLSGPDSIVAAGYSVYGAKTSLVYSSGNGVLDFTLDPSIGEFVLTEENLTCPSQGEILSVNEGNRLYWSDAFNEYLDEIKRTPALNGQMTTCRYVGSLVADFDRTLRRGGIFLYPPSSKHPKGRLRLLYECIPLAYLMEQAKGMALDGSRRVLDVPASDIHQRCGLVAGSVDEVQRYLTLTRGGIVCQC